MKNISKPKKGV
jgi:hypothetical protein